MQDTLAALPVTGAGPSLYETLRRVRECTVSLCRPLSAEDCVVQSAPEASPAKWHLAHTTWFFENFVLEPFAAGYRGFHPQFGYLFNSYYETVGTFHPRRDRGLLTRPALEEVHAYRVHVDERLADLLVAPRTEHTRDIEQRITLGIHHEQQHQELILTDIKHLFSTSPLRPAYRPALEAGDADVPALVWLSFPSGLYEAGHAGDGFAFDNEAPRHRRYLESFRIASRPVLNAEYIGFIDDGGYGKPALWLSDGWQAVKTNTWQAPMYWEHRDGAWWQMTLAGMRQVDPAEPVCHVSYYEADAYARWAGKRLPSEFEWEVAASLYEPHGNFLDSGRLHPAPCGGEPRFFGDVWEWTQSPYAAYPGYRPSAGALGEYNGKFMINQMVLRGGSCATPASHIRPTYRNFFYPHDRWQFKGFRLADG
jgi:ergothioneine biosynthesis protein EgtB